MNEEGNPKTSRCDFRCRDKRGLPVESAAHSSSCHTLMSSLYLGLCLLSAPRRVVVLVVFGVGGCHAGRACFISYRCLEDSKIIACPWPPANLTRVSRVDDLFVKPISVPSLLRNGLNDAIEEKKQELCGSEHSDFDLEMKHCS